jgi:hypothetical protein
MMVEADVALLRLDTHKVKSRQKLKSALITLLTFLDAIQPVLLVQNGPRRWMSRTGLIARGRGAERWMSAMPTARASRVRWSIADGGACGHTIDVVERVAVSSI